MKLAPVLLFAVVIRLLLVTTLSYRSTDFEVHRNWLAITHSLPVSKWYVENTSEWTLDYPPSFAYFECGLSYVAEFFDPAMLQVENLEYASFETIAFQRISVILGDIVLALGAWKMARPYTADRAAVVALMLLNPALLLVDHVHFQYNGMLFGLLLLSIAEIEAGHICRGAAFFCLLVNMKHIFIYCAPVFFVYLLRGHCACSFSQWSIRLRFQEFAKLAAVVLTTFILMWAPIISTGQFSNAVQRLFPFGRGLTHAYWAPNVWALYNTVDRALDKLSGTRTHLTSFSSTAGKAEVFETSVLWPVPPKATFALVLILYMPLLKTIWRQTTPSHKSHDKSFHAQPVRHGSALATYVALGSAISFSVGWHVHEKALIMVTVPLLVVAASSRQKEVLEATAALSTITTFSVLPLIPDYSAEKLAKWVLFSLGHGVEFIILRKSYANFRKSTTGPSILKVWPFSSYFVVMCMAVLGLYSDFGLHVLLFGKARMEFLPLLLMSDFCAVLVLLSFADRKSVV